VNNNTDGQAGGPFKRVFGLVSTRSLTQATDMLEQATLAESK